MKKTPLHVAVADEQIEVISNLISYGANVNAIDSDGMTPLHLAIELRNVKIIKMLIDAGADICARNELNLMTPLEMAIKSKCKRILKVFIQADCLRAEDGDGTTPLHAAAVWGNSENVQLLLKKGADVNAKGKDQQTPVHWSIDSENVNILRSFIKAGGDINARDVNRITPLHLAVENEDLNFVIVLTNAGCDVNAKSIKGYTPLHLAVQSKNLNIVNVLLAAGSNINERDAFGNSSLFFAVNLGDANVSNLLIDAGANINATDIYKTTPLHVAAQVRNYTIMRLLIDSGANVSLRDHNQDTPLTVLIKSLLVLKETSEETQAVKESVRLLVEYTDVNVLIGVLECVHFVSAKKFFENTILQHIAILKTLDYPLDRRVLSVISFNASYSKYIAVCLKELKKTKSIIVKDGWVTFLNLLVDDTYKLVKYAGNKDLVRCFKKRVNKFPIFGPVMESNMLRGTFGCKLYNTAANNLSYYLPIFKPSHTIIKDILDDLSEKDWQKLCKFYVTN